LTECENALKVLAEEHGFHSGKIRLVFLQHLGYFLIDDTQSFRNGFALVYPDDFAPCCRYSALFNFQKSISAEPAAGIDADYPIG
jgi:hypothetical protein